MNPTIKLYNNIYNIIILYILLYNYYAEKVYFENGICRLVDLSTSTEKEAPVES